MAIRDLMVSIDFATNFKTLDMVDSKVSDLSKDLNKMGGVGNKAFSDVSRSALSVSGHISDLNRSSQSFTEKLSTGFDNAISKMNTFGDRVQSVGSKMTKNITAPIAGAVTAVGGLTTALGFKRLVGMDNAQAKLRGLGYEGSAIGEIMKDVNAAVTGTTHTMAEGVDVAAGALAAGISQGPELERYIKLVGDAATGSNRPMSDMAQIFNRIQGSGKLMTDELNMIEHGMPGFSRTMAEHLGVTNEEFRKMVTDGKVSSAEFLNVMEGFAGGMSDAFAGTWSGMVKNVMSNIGILGESLLSGLFEDGKKGLADFLDILRSDELRMWAKETGQTIREMTHNFIDTLRDLKGFWDGLSPPIQNALKNVALFGGIGLTVTGPLMRILGPAIKGVSLAMKGLNIAFLKSPIGWVTLALVGLVGAAIWAYREFDWFKDIVHDAWDHIKTGATIAWSWVQGIIQRVIITVVPFVTQKLNELRVFWDENSERIVQTIQLAYETIKTTIQIGMEFISGLFAVVWPIISGAVGVAWESIKFFVNTGIDIITGLVVAGMEFLSGDWGEAWETIKGIAFEIWENIEEFFAGIDLFEIGQNIIQGLIDGFSSMKDAVWEAVKGVGSWITDGFMSLFNMASPSRLMMELGGFIGEGLQIGLDNSALMVAKSAQDLAKRSNPAAYYTPEKTHSQVQSSAGQSLSIGDIHLHISGVEDARQAEIAGREAGAAFRREVLKLISEYQRREAIRTV